MADDVLLAFDEFYARYQRRLRGFVISVYGAGDAEDIAQEAMVRACASFTRLDRDREPWPWLVAIVRNVVRDRRARPDTVPIDDVPAVARDTTADVEERHLVRAALGRLSSSDRDVLVLRECHDLTFGELSRLLGRSPNTIRQQVFRARRRLADAYTALGGRALGLAGAAGRWWREVAPAQVAAAVIVGTLLGGGPPAPVGADGVVAGPVARGGAPAGPATGRAAPVRPLQPARAARVDPPRDPGAGRAAESEPDLGREPESAVGNARPRPGVSGGASGSGYDLSWQPRGDAGLCLATDVC